MGSRLPKNLPPVGRTTPAVIYHYTNLIGLRGVLQGKNIRAGRYNRMNDPSEVRHAVCVLGRWRIKRRFEDAGPAEKWGAHIMDLYEQYPHYIVSFCEDGDSSTQRETYGHYAIGFRTERLRQKVNLRTGGQFTKMDYSDANKFGILDNLFRGDPVREPLNALPSLLKFKKEDSSSELEWRLVGRPSGFRDGKKASSIVEGKTVEFIEVALLEGDIEVVVLGPTESSPENQRAIEQLVASRGFQVRVETSPLRYEDPRTSITTRCSPMSSSPPNNAD